MHLSSCYFCGTALDAPVAEYAIAPGSSGDEERTVTLCPTCRRKLTKVLDTAGEATEPLTALDSDGEAGTPTQLRASGTGDPGTDDGSVSSDGESVAATGADSDGVGTVADTSSDEAAGSTDGAVSEANADADGGDTSGGESETDITDGEADSDEDAAADDEQPADDSSGAVPEDGRDGSAARASDPGTTDAGIESPDSDTGPESVASGPSEATDAGATGAVESGGTDADGADDSDGAADESPSVLTTSRAKKVIRLLQNRQFPVDREEFGVVAANAYDIPRQDCSDILDALVEEGYVGEEGGQLVRPEE